VVSEGDQQVFASSKAPKGKQAPGASEAGAGSPSESSAASDVWTGLESSSAGGSATPAPASLGDEGSSGSSLGLAILALGLVGVLGTLAALAVPRRRRTKAEDGGSR